MAKEKSTQENRKRRVISRLNLPARLPFVETAVLILYMLHFPPRFWWQYLIFSIVILIVSFIWFVEIFSLFTERQVDLIKALDIAANRLILEDIHKIYENMLNKNKERRNG